ncbi:MAG: MFS transporter [Gammaproteobacteria bacterium]|nr:MFS transporter [Gammaproteobacteria bacterium]
MVGFCSCILFMVIESWLNVLAQSNNRGQLFSAYIAVYMFSSGLAPLWLVAVDPYTPALLLVSSAFFTLCLIPVALTPVVQPTAIAEARFDLRSIWRNSPLGVIGTFAAGMSLGVVYTLAPAFALQFGMTETQTAMFLIALFAGGGLLQWPLGRISDYVDRRWVLIMACFFGAGFAFAFDFIGSFSLTLLAVSALMGGCLSSMYPLSVAYSNDHASPESALNISQSLLLFYGIGAVVGPVLTGVVMSLFGSEYLPMTLVVFLIVPGLYGLYRVTRRAPVPSADQHEYVPMVQTTPVEFEMHPQISSASVK